MIGQGRGGYRRHAGVQWLEKGSGPQIACFAITPPGRIVVAFVEEPLLFPDGLRGVIADPLDPLRTRVGALVEQILDLLRDRTLYVKGAINMLEQPEFLDIGAVRQMLRTFEDKDHLIELLSNLSRWGGLQVTIGEENPVAELQDCTLVTSTYSYRDQVLGILGIVGPRRMRYPQVISIVEDAALQMSERLSRVRRDLYLPS